MSLHQLGVVTFIPFLVLAACLALSRGPCTGTHPCHPGMSVWVAPVILLLLPQVQCRIPPHCLLGRYCSL